jgi:phosphohistidine phosphatase
MRTRPDYYYDQSAVIPYRLRDGAVEVLTITSRRRKRWIVPKGVREPDLTAAASAAKEALEEAGVEGQAAPASLGSYSYEKWGGTCSVEVYAMRVTREHEHWLEDFRTREWVPLEKAAQRMQESDLQQIMSTLPEHIHAP